MAIMKPILVARGHFFHFFEHKLYLKSINIINMIKESNCLSVKCILVQNERIATSGAVSFEYVKILK